ncbi:MAG: glutamate synthase large subunit, partial [cyanobacterium endosymbiont of Rhopalodia inflata]
LELLVRTGRSPLEATMILVPEAYQNQPDLKDYPEITSFYQYYSGFQEPWDGPALLTFSDGKIVGACLDRNGLRPARYCITKDDYLVVGSEAGVVDLPEEDIIVKGRLGPGQTIAADLESKEILKNWDIKKRISRQHPYWEWLQTFRKKIIPQPFSKNILLEQPGQLLQQQTAFGYTAEDVEIIVVPMATEGKEPIFCMGDDIPLAVLSNKPHLLYDYFKQRFAQVTNPPIDPLREGLVMSLEMLLGERGNLLDPKPEDAKLLTIESPLLNETELEQIKSSEFQVTQLSTLFDLTAGPGGLEIGLDRLCDEAIQAVKDGSKIIILSDRTSEMGSVAETTSYIPPLLAVGTIHHYLIKHGLRLQTSLVIDTAQCWSTHHFACLVGYGASAVCPYLTLETIRQWWNDTKTQKLMGNGKIESISLDQAFANYRHAVELGLLKIISKMGISLLASYHGAQTFEAIGLSPELIKMAFDGTTSRVGGLSIVELAEEIIAIHSRAFPSLTDKKLKNFGFINYRPGGEYHMNSPKMAKFLHKAVAVYKEGINGRNNKGYDHYAMYSKYLEERPITALRDLLEFNSDRPSISVEEVETVEAIVKRFCIGGMSLGALSREAHETIAIAMNRLGGKSNSGEGGEDPIRFTTLTDVDANGNSPTFPHLNGLKNGDTASSAIKQIASGRFGVTPEYLMNGKQLEIKMAQGAKPGEGGQLPGQKVNSYIAMLRQSRSGVTLISPPPHHDIYSIEDLAQLIFDLHQINPMAKVSVKLVAEIGIGTIAVGVAKANADVIQVSGHEGGTGASPLSSIKHAGCPWELGITEVHRMLLKNQLRDRVILRADGGLKTGWDVMMAALMGAEQYGFGSIAIIAEGCIMARICHTNNCPVGVATQQKKLRQRFSGVPENVTNLFYFIAEEIRSILAKLGYHSLNEVIGRSDLLISRKKLKLTKTQTLNLDCLIKLPNVKEDRSWLKHEAVHSNGEVLDDRILADKEIISSIDEHRSVTKNIKIVNTDRTVGARISGVIAKKYGNTGLKGKLTLNFKGTSGQSFGAFNLPGMILYLEGEANDYVGKGMHGGEIVIVPHKESNYKPEDNVIIGNTCLYGSTGGFLYANGRAGERFGVRNTLGKAVIEGAGDHCCEYMTGGVIVVLGTIGRNVGAGMTGGIGYFLDEEANFPEKVNFETVEIQRICTEAGKSQLKELIQSHVDRTHSQKGKIILDSWEDYVSKFWQVFPPSEANSPEINSNPVTVKEKTLTPVK